MANASLRLRGRILHGHHSGLVRGELRLTKTQAIAGTDAEKYGFGPIEEVDAMIVG